MNKEKKIWEQDFKSTIFANWENNVERIAIPGQSNQKRQ
jgi:hypothetical protein